MRNNPLPPPRRRLKRSPMPNRKEPLARISAKRAAALRTPAGGSSTPIPARPRVRPAVTRAKRKTLAVRSGEWCEIQLKGCWGRATDPHHRVTRKDGGRKGAARERSDRLSSLLHVCRPCHGEVHRTPGTSHRWANGWLVRERFDPALRPVLYRGEMSYMDDLGGVYDYETAGA